MKLGTLFIAIGVICFIALVVFLIMSLIMGDYAGAVWGTIYTSVAGSLWLSFGIKRVKKVRGSNAGR